MIGLETKARDECSKEEAHAALEQAQIFRLTKTNRKPSKRLDQNSHRAGLISGRFAR